MADSKSEAPKHARRVRKSILDINIGQQTTQKMNLRAGRAKNAIPFKAGRMQYEAPKFLSSAVTPPRMKRRPTKTRLNENSTEPDETNFIPEPIMCNIDELPFEPIKESFNSLYDDKENISTPEEWMAQEAEKFVPEPVDNPFFSAECATEASEEEARDIKAEIQTVKQKLVGVVGSSIYLNRKIPDVEKMLQNTELFSENDILGVWDMMLGPIEKMLEKSMERLSEEEDE